jgi:hypothetical protein
LKNQDVAAFRKGGYERVLTTGGPITAWQAEPAAWKDFASRAAHYLRTHGLEHVPVDAVPTPATLQERTYLSAVRVRQWLHQAQVPTTAIDVYSSGVHARRSRTLYAMAFGPRVAVGVMAARPDVYDADRWWASSAGTKAVMGEVISLAWTACCFWPGRAPDMPPPAFSPSSAASP